MVAGLIHVVRLLIVLASRHRTLVLENVALRQQLAVYRRTRAKPAVRWSDRLFWIGRRLAWSDWKSALVVVKAPDPRQNSSELILVPAPARIESCSSC